MFQRFAADHVWPREPAPDLRHLIIWLTYIIFIIFVVLVAVAALRVFGALIPRFTEPTAFEQGGGEPAEPYSPLFYKGILSVCPDRWGAFFANLTSKSDLSSKRPNELDAFYAKSSIFETYLVASDVEKKVTAFKTAIAAVRSALWALIAFLVFFFSTIILTRPDATTANPAASASPTAAVNIRSPTVTHRPVPTR